MDKELQKLIDRLEGKTVEKVEATCAPESVFQLQLTDGSSFRIYATDLGWWLEDLVSKSGFYPSIEAICTEVYNLADPDTDLLLFDVTIKDGILQVCVFLDNLKEVRYKAEVSKLSEWGQKVCNHPKGLHLIQQALKCPWESYMSIFSKHSKGECPSELYYSEP